MDDSVVSRIDDIFWLDFLFGSKDCITVIFLEGLLWAVESIYTWSVDMDLESSGFDAWYMDCDTWGSLILGYSWSASAKFTDDGSVLI